MTQSRREFLKIVGVGVPAAALAVRVPADTGSPMPAAAAPDAVPPTAVDPTQGPEMFFGTLHVTNRDPDFIAAFVRQCEQLGLP